MLTVDMLNLKPEIKTKARMFTFSSSIQHCAGSPHQCHTEEREGKKQMAWKAWNSMKKYKYHYLKIAGLWM